MTTTEQLKKLKQLRGQAPDPEVPAPSTLVHPLTAQADQLEQQAQPQPTSPQTWKETVLAGIVGGLTPGGYSGVMAGRQKDEQARQQQLLSRAQQARQGGFQQQQLASQQENQQANRDFQDRQLSSEDAYRVAQVNKIQQPQDEFTDAANIGVYSKRTGEIKTPAGKPVTEKNQGTRDRFDEKTKHMFRDYFDQSAPDVVTSSADLGPAGPSRTAMPGSMQPAVDSYGNITAMVNTETGAITPAQTPPGIGGQVRKQGAAPGLVQQSQETDTSYNQLSKLGEVFKPEFVGPVQGRLLRTKALLPEQMASLPAGYTDFAALQADAVNSFIKFMTGAQMSESEAKRLAKQMPSGEARADVWKSNYDNMMRRVKFVKGMLDKGLSLQGMTADQLDKEMGGSGPANPQSSTAPTKPLANGGFRIIK